MTFKNKRQLWQLKPGDEFHLILRDKKDTVVRKVIGAGEEDYVVTDGEKIDKISKNTQVYHIKQY